MRGICSFYEDITDCEGIFNRKVIVKNKSLLLSGENIFCTQREGAVLCVKGYISNLAEISVKFDIKDTVPGKMLLSLFLIKGEDFVKELEGDFIITILDEITKKLHIFTDFNNLNRVYVAPIKNGFVFSVNITEVITCPLFNPIINTEGLLKLFAMPYAYNGEYISKVHSVLGDEYLTISKDGAYIKKIERRIVSIKPKNFDERIYTITSKGYPELMINKMDFKSYEKELKNKILCTMDSFNYESINDIERAEAFYLHYMLYLKNYLFSCRLKNNPDLLNPACLKWLYENKKEKIVMGTTNKVHLAQDVRKIVAHLCENKGEPVFKVLKRSCLSEACFDIEESFLLFVLRVNKFFKEFEPYLEFRTD